MAVFQVITKSQPNYSFDCFSVGLWQQPNCNFGCGCCWAVTKTTACLYAQHFLKFKALTFVFTLVKFQQTVSQGYIFFKWPLFYSPRQWTLHRKLLRMKMTQPFLINVLNFIFRPLWSQNYVKIAKVLIICPKFGPRYKYHYHPSPPHFEEYIPLRSLYT